MCSLLHVSTRRGCLRNSGQVFVLNETLPWDILAELLIKEVFLLEGWHLIIVLPLLDIVLSEGMVKLLAVVIDTISDGIVAIFTGTTEDVVRLWTA